MKKTFIVFLTSFLLWAIAATIGAEFINTNLWKTQDSDAIQQNQELNLEEFWGVYQIVKEEYFSNEEIQKEELVSGAIEGMVEALGDRHSEFMNPEVTERFEEALTWDFEGIGAVVEKVALWIQIERILKGSPAKKYDVRAGDIIIKADEYELEKMELYDGVEKIKWPAGSTVLLTILRPWEEKILEISVVRDKIHIPSIEEEYYEEENIAYIAVNLYGESTAEEFRKALENVKQSQVEGLIIDVRDNGGGYLQSAVEILSEFIPTWETLVKTRYQDSYFDQVYSSQNDGSIYDKKIVVLVNGNSASAAEITAWALREYDKAILVWEKSYGKGSVQQPFELPSGSLLKLTVAKWFTPLGANIDEEGITPDIEVKFLEEDYENKYDRQLEEAKELLQIYIEKQTIGLAIEAYEIENPKIEEENSEG